MTKSRSLPVRAPSSTLPRSLRWRFALAFVTLLAVVVVGFSWAAYRAAYGGSLEAAGTRLEVVASQVASMLEGNIEGFVAGRGPGATDPRLRAAFASDSPTAVAAAAALLDSLAAGVPVIRAVSLHRADGDVVLFGGRDPAAASVPLEPARDADERTPWVSGFRRYGSALGFAVGLPVREDGRLLGWLTYYADLGVSPEAASRITELIGRGVSLSVGVPGGVWTDLLAEIPPPPPEVAGTSAAEAYRSSQGLRVLGAGDPVSGTPWRVRIEQTQHEVLAPARALLARLIPVGLLVLVVGGLAGWGLSHQITSRLTKLTDAASVVASGDYAKRVPDQGEDEVAELARAFNTMAQQIENARERLEADVASRTAELRAANQELEAFSYSVSHDLRTPLRAIHGFSRAVVLDHGSSLPEAARADLQRVCTAAEHMAHLIDDLLEMSRTARVEIRLAPLDLTAMASEIVEELRATTPDRSVEVRIGAGLTARGDRSLMSLVLRNLLENAWKFTSKQARAEVEFAWAPEAGAFVVRDNGAGFDPAHAHKLFQPFERLHAPEDYEGTGVGLALVSRIIHRHGGRVWAEGTNGQGAAFYLTLPGGAA